MKIKDTVKLPGIRSIVTGTHFGIPAARYMEGSVVKSAHLGPLAAKRAYEECSAIEPDMNLPEALQATADPKE